MGHVGDNANLYYLAWISMGLVVAIVYQVSVECVRQAETLSSFRRCTPLSLNRGPRRKKQGYRYMMKSARLFCQRRLVQCLVLCSTHAYAVSSFCDRETNVKAHFVGTRGEPVFCTMKDAIAVGKPYTGPSIDRENELSSHNSIRSPYIISPLISCLKGL